MIAKPPVVTPTAAPAVLIAKPPAVVAKPLPVIDPAAQAYALRVWNGQSVDVPPTERAERVVSALEGQDLDTNVTLPNADAMRFLKQYNK